MPEYKCYVDSVAPANAPGVLISSPFTDEYTTQLYLISKGFNVIKTNNSSLDLTENLHEHCDVKVNEIKIDNKRVKRFYDKDKKEYNVDGDTILLNKSIYDNNYINICTIFPYKDRYFIVIASVDKIKKCLVKYNCNVKLEQNGKQVQYRIPLGALYFADNNYLDELTGNIKNTYDLMAKTYDPIRKLNLEKWTKETPIEKRIEDRDKVLNIITPVFQQCYGKTPKIEFAHHG